jgi:hypothetical protein
MALCMISIRCIMMFGQMASNYAVFSTGFIGSQTPRSAHLRRNGLIGGVMQFPISRSISHMRNDKAMAAGSLTVRLFGYGMWASRPPWAWRCRTGSFAKSSLSGHVHVHSDMGEMVVSPSSMSLVLDVPRVGSGRYSACTGCQQLRLLGRAVSRRPCSSTHSRRSNIHVGRHRSLA